MSTVLARLTIIGTLIVLPVTVLAQIPNAGFENWSSDTLNGWWTNNIPSVDTTITKSNIAHTGSSAVRGTVVTFFSNVVQPIIQSGSDEQGFPYSQRPASFTGYYQFFPAASSGDRFAVNVELYKGGINGTIVGVAAAALSASVSSYTQFAVTFTYQTSDMPDTCVVQVQIIGPGTGAQATPSVGSYFLLDDIAFTGVSRVADSRVWVPQAFRLYQNYPNPFNPTTNISFTVPSNGKAALTVFNLLGQRVGILFDGAVVSGTTYRAIFNASWLPSGVYFSRLDFVPAGSSGPATELMRKMTLIK